LKISISKICEKARIYEKALSMFVVQKSMAILKRPAKISDIPGYISEVANKEHTIMKQPLVQNEYPIPEEHAMEKSSSRSLGIFCWPPHLGILVSLAPDLCKGSEPPLVSGGIHRKASIYKIGEYKITENDSDDLLWEMHFGMGAIKEGKCFRKGQILFLCSAHDERPGFLKGEYLDHIKPFPCWRKTRYYCSGFHIRRCDTGEKVSEHEMRLWVNDPKRHFAHKGDCQKHDPILKTNSSDGNNVEVSYMLNNYEIAINGNGSVLWKKCGTHNRVNSGGCFIMEDILFIGPSENEQPDSLKRQFHEQLNLLPKWDCTEYYSSNIAILECNPAR